MKEFSDIFTEKDEKKNELPLTYVVFIMDHSGSMAMGKEQTRMNFNEQLASIKKEEDVENLVTLIEFDNEIRKIYERKPINEVKDLEGYWTGGTTSLYDAISVGISSVRDQVESSENNSALVVIMSDGHENSSKEFRDEEGRKKIKNMIKELEETKKWTFVYMGADLSKEEVEIMTVSGLGMNANNTYSFQKTEDGYRNFSETMNTGLKTYYSARRNGETYISNFVDNGNSSKEE